MEPRSAERPALSLRNTVGLVIRTTGAVVPCALMVNERTTTGTGRIVVVRETTFIPERGGCKWMTIYEHGFQTGSNRKPERETVRCCACGTKVPYVESWVVVPYGAHGNSLPLPVFIHCDLCSMTLDPQVAYQSAFARDAKASLPDPEKVRREQELNEQMSQIPGLENRI